MPWCPHCKTEYQPGINKCADCGADLVDHLPQEQLVFDGQPVFLTEVHHDAEAVLLVQLLQDNGIPVLQHGCNEADHLSILYTGATLCGQKLYVSSHQLAQAKGIVQAYQSKKGDFLYEPDAFTQPDESEFADIDDKSEPVRPRKLIRLAIICAISLLIGFQSPVLGILVFLVLSCAAFLLS